jgi:hypothetical protein
MQAGLSLILVVSSLGLSCRTSNKRDIAEQLNQVRLILEPTLIDNVSIIIMFGRYA